MILRVSDPKVSNSSNDLNCNFKLFEPKTVKLIKAVTEPNLTKPNRTEPEVNSLRKPVPEPNRTVQTVKPCFCGSSGLFHLVSHTMAKFSEYMISHQNYREREANWSRQSKAENRGRRRTGEKSPSPCPIFLGI